VLGTSRIAFVEVVRAVGIANPNSSAQREAERLLASCLLVDVDDALLRAAARAASREIRTLDAIHLASAQRVEADEVLVYDDRLTEAARGAGFVASRPT
jgi:predicted nucleic acid-binding protein